MNDKRKILDTIKAQSDFIATEDYLEYIADDFGDVEYDLLKKFINGTDFGLINETRKNRNIKNIKGNAGDVIGIYKNPKSNLAEDNLVIYYDHGKDKIWFLTYDEFTLYPRAEWGKNENDRDKKGEDFFMEKYVPYDKQHIKKAEAALTQQQKAKLKEIAEDYAVTYENLILECMDYANDHPIIVDGKETFDIKVGYDWLVKQDFDSNTLGIEPRGGVLKKQPDKDRQFEREYTNEQMAHRVKREFSLPFDVAVIEKELGADKINQIKKMAEEIDASYEELLNEYARWKGFKNAPIESATSGSGRVTEGAFDYLKAHYKDPGFIKDTNEIENQGLFYDIKDVELVRNRDTTEVKYNGKFYDYVTFLATLIRLYHEDLEEEAKESGVVYEEVENSITFDDWIYFNAKKVYNILKIMKPIVNHIEDAKTFYGLDDIKVLDSGVVEYQGKQYDLDELTDMIFEQYHEDLYAGGENYHGANAMEQMEHDFPINQWVDQFPEAVYEMFKFMTPIKVDND